MSAHRITYIKYHEKNIFIPPLFFGETTKTATTPNFFVSPYCHCLYDYRVAKREKLFFPAIISMSAFLSYRSFFAPFADKIKLKWYKEQPQVYLFLYFKQFSFNHHSSWEQIYYSVFFLKIKMHSKIKTYYFIFQMTNF